MPWRERNAVMSVAPAQVGTTAATRSFSLPEVPSRQETRMEDRKTVTEVRRDIDRMEDEGAWGFGTLLAVIAACFLVLGVMIYMFGEDQTTQTAGNNPPRAERTIKNAPAPSPPAEPSTVGQGGQ
jgi:hypothetical protein